MTTTIAVHRQRPPAAAIFAVPGLASQHLPRPVGPMDHLPAGEVLTVLAALPFTSYAWTRVAGTRIRGAGLVLAWLASMPGDGWQDRWLTSGADASLDWVDQLTADDPRGKQYKHQEVMLGLSSLLMCRLVQPGYTFLTGYRAVKLFTHVQTAVSPEVFVTVHAAAQQRAMTGDQIKQALTVLAKMVLHTGKDLGQITVEDFYELQAWGTHGHGGRTLGIHGAWDLLRDAGVLTATTPLRTALRAGQRPTSELVARHQLACQPVRDVLVRYLDHRRPAMDYSSFRQLLSTLVFSFWAELEHHHPGIATLDLPADIAGAWKQRLLHVTKGGGEVAVRKNRLSLLAQVRSFYLDIAEWALEDASWAQWAVPSPVRRADLEGFAKRRDLTTADMHQRVRDRLPHLPLLVSTAEQHRDEQSALLALASQAAIGTTFDHDGQSYRRSDYPTAIRSASARPGPAAVLVNHLATGRTSDLIRTEDDAFWAWAIIETLRHTGVRREELLEITHLALVSHRLPDTGEVIPLLQIVPSKVNEERLLLVTPELASVLAAIVRRVRPADGRVPLVERYDQHERTTGPPLPHLFQRRRGWRHEVIGPRTVVLLLNETTARAGLTDAAGNPLQYTPHDFRRLFATEAVTGGLPVHIAAKILGHHHLATTQSYLAVFQDELIRSYRAFLDKRRAERPEAEYREPTDAEWQDFQQHFELRKLELGTCGRPYGTPCC